ncbi:MAG: Fe-S-containing protein [Chloroflexota bacterium]
MVESAIVTLREGIEAALIIGIILAYLRKTGREHLRRPVYAGLVLAIAASVAVAWLFQALGFDPENEYLEGTMLGVAGLFVASMVVWMWRTARGLRAGMESRLTSLTAGTSGRLTAMALLAFTFLMVLREGVETVLFLAAATAGEKGDAYSLVGAVLGLGLATLFAVLFVRGSVRVNLSRFFTVTAIALLVLSARLLAGSAHEFGEVRLLPLNKEVMALLGFLVRGDTSSIIVAALVALPIFTLLWESLRNSPDRIAPQTESAPERRKRLARSHAERTWQLGLGGATMLVIAGMVSTTVAGSAMLDPIPEPVSSSGSMVGVPIARLSEGRMFKFTYTAAGGEHVRFLLTRLSDGSVASALDACPICGSVGYGQEGSIAICKNCNAPIPFDTFAFSGGCNPLPLGAELQSEEALVSVSVADLEAAADKFR